MDAAEILFAPTRWGLRLAWSRLVDLGSIDSGSNPGGPTINTFGLLFFVSSCCREPPIHNNNQRAVRAAAFLVLALVWVAGWLCKQTQVLRLKHKRNKNRATSRAVKQEKNALLNPVDLGRLIDSISNSEGRSQSILQH
jgi:hypothetical protein